MDKILTTGNTQLLFGEIKKYVDDVADLIVNGCQVNLTGSNITLDKQTLPYGKPATVNAEVSEGYEVTNSEITMGNTSILFNNSSMSFQIPKVTANIDANFTVGQAEVYFKKLRGKQGKQKTLEMWVNLPTDCMYIWGYLQLPDGVTPASTIGHVFSNNDVRLGTNYLSESNRLGFMVYAPLTNEVIESGHYKLLEIYLNFANDAEIGDYTLEFVQENAYTGFVNASPNGGITIKEDTSANSGHTVYPKVKMNIIGINDADIILTESDTTAPKAMTDAKVLLRKAFPANAWTAVALPFGLTKEQFQSAFGENAQLAFFVDYQLGNTMDSNDKYEDGVIYFSLGDASEGDFNSNTPLLVKPDTDLSEVVFDNVTIDPQERDCQVRYDNGLSYTHPKYEEYMRMVGQYSLGVPRLINVGPLFLFTENGLQPISSTDMVPAYGCYIEEESNDLAPNAQLSIAVS